MKKLIALFMAGFLCISLAGCGNDPGSDASTGSSTSSMDESTSSQPDETSSGSSTDSSSSDEVKKVDPKEYTTKTDGKYSYDDKEMPIGSKITAYPLDIEELFTNRTYLFDSDGLYEGDWVSFTGYVHFYKDGYFNLSWSNSGDVEESIDVVLVEDKNISADNGWNIKDGDKITIVGYFKGVYLPWGDECYIVLNDAFIVE